MRRRAGGYWAVEAVLAGGGGIPDRHLRKKRIRPSSGATENREGRSHTGKARQVRALTIPHVPKWWRLIKSRGSDEDL